MNDPPPTQRHAMPLRRGVWPVGPVGPMCPGGSLTGGALRRAVSCRAGAWPGCQRDHRYASAPLKAREAVQAGGALDLIETWDKVYEGGIVPPDVQAPSVSLSTVGSGICTPHRAADDGCRAGLVVVGGR